MIAAPNYRYSAELQTETEKPRINNFHRITIIQAVRNNLPAHLLYESVCPTRS